MIGFNFFSSPTSLLFVLYCLSLSSCDYMLLNLIFGLTHFLLPVVSEAYSPFLYKLDFFVCTPKSVEHTFLCLPAQQSYCLIPCRTNSLTCLCSSLHSPVWTPSFPFPETRVTAHASSLRNVVGFTTKFV